MVCLEVRSTSRQRGKALSKSERLLKWSFECDEALLQRGGVQVFSERFIRNVAFICQDLWKSVGQSFQ